MNSRMESKLYQVDIETHPKLDAPSFIWNTKFSECNTARGAGPFVLEFDGKVYIDHKALTLLIGGNASGIECALKLDGKMFFDIEDEDIMSSVKRHYSYPPRNQREAKVRNRNKRFWAMIWTVHVNYTLRLHEEENVNG